MERVYNIHHRELAAIVRGEIELTPTRAWLPLGALLQTRIRETRPRQAVRPPPPEEALSSIEQRGAYPCRSCSEVFDVPWKLGVHTKAVHFVRQGDLIPQVLEWLGQRGGRGRLADLSRALLPNRSQHSFPKVLRSTLDRMEDADLIQKGRSGENRQTRIVALGPEAPAPDVDPDALLGCLCREAERVLGRRVLGIRVILELENPQERDAPITMTLETSREGLMLPA